VSVVVHIGVTSCNTGGSLSIRSTIAVVFHVTHISFLNVNTNVQFPVNVCHVSLNHVVPGVHPVKVAITSHDVTVQLPGLYST
jgi:hypothetical protein